MPPSPTPHGFIADGGPVLDSAAHARLDARIAAVQRATGGDVGVAILRDLAGHAPSDVGVAIYRGWKVGAVDSLGSARRHLGALLLIVPKELSPARRGECWITTGLGAEATLLDGDAGTICRDSVIPHLRERRYEAAVAAGIDGIGGALAEASGGAPRGKRYSWSSEGTAPGAEELPLQWKALVVSLAMLPLLLVGALVYGLVRLVGALRAREYRRPRPCPRGHGPMPRLEGQAEAAALTDGQRTEERIGSVDYGVYTCAQCDARVMEVNDGPRKHQRCPGCANRTLTRTERPVRLPTVDDEGIWETTRTCAHCRWRDSRQRTTPRLPYAVSASVGSSSSSFAGSSSDSSSSSSSSSSSFGGDGGTSGGGGGASY